MAMRDFLSGAVAWTAIRLVVLAGIAACAITPKADYESTVAQIRATEASALTRAEFARADAIHGCRDRTPPEVIPCTIAARYAYAVKTDSIRAQTKRAEEQALSDYAHARALKGLPE